MTDETNQTDSNEVQVDVEKRIKDFCAEMSASFLRGEAERDFRKEAIARLSEQTGIEKSVLNFCAKTYHKQDFDEKTKSAEEQREFYVRIFGEPTGDNSGDDFDDE